MSPRSLGAGQGGRTNFERLCRSRSTGHISRNVREAHGRPAQPDTVHDQEVGPSLSATANRMAVRLSQEPLQMADHVLV